jgi:hypothetical protein
MTETPQPAPKETALQEAGRQPAQDKPDQHQESKHVPRLPKALATAIAIALIALAQSERTKNQPVDPTPHENPAVEVLPDGTMLTSVESQAEIEPNLPDAVITPPAQSQPPLPAMPNQLQEFVPVPPPAEIDLYQPFTMTIAFKDGSTHVMPIIPTESPATFRDIGSGTSQVFPSENSWNLTLHSGFNGEYALIAEVLRQKLEGYTTDKPILFKPEIREKALTDIIGTVVTLTNADGHVQTYTITAAANILNHPSSDNPLLSRLDWLRQSTTTFLRRLQDLTKGNRSDFDNKPGTLIINFCGWGVTNSKLNTRDTIYAIELTPAGQTNQEILPAHQVTGSLEATAAGFIFSNHEGFGTAYTPEDRQISLATLAQEYSALSSAFHPDTREYQYAYSLISRLHPGWRSTDITNYLNSLTIGTGPTHDANLRDFRFGSQGSHAITLGEHWPTASGIVLDQSVLDNPTLLAQLLVEENVQIEQLNRTLLRPGVLSYLINTGYLTDAHADPYAQLARGNMRAYLEFWQQAFLAEGGMSTSPYTFEFNSHAFDLSDNHAIQTILDFFYRLTGERFTLWDMLFNERTIPIIDSELNEQYGVRLFDLFGASRPNLSGTDLNIPSTLGIPFAN